MGHDGLPHPSPTRADRVGDRPRVLSVPHRDPYVQGVVDADEVVLLGVPGPADETPLALDPHWVADHLRDFDVLHVHRGFEHVDVWRLRELVGLLRGHGKRLLLTVHDLRHPGLGENTAQDQRLDVLVPAADHVLTLTRSAAVDIARRWSRGAGVLPHPCVVPPDAMARLRAPWARRRGRVGLHLGSVPENADVGPVLRALERLVAEDPSTSLDVRIHDQAWDERPRLRERLLRLDARPDVDVYVHDSLTEPALNGWLGSLHALVLPDRFGTHSTMLERAKDLATATVGADIGGYRDQGLVATFPVRGERLAADDVLAAVRDALAAEPALPRPAERQVERADVRLAHTRLYRRLAGLSATRADLVVVPEHEEADERAAAVAEAAEGDEVAASSGDRAAS